MTEPTLARAHLQRLSEGFVWIVDHCPYCGRRHTHGGGPLSTDPRLFLGSRAPHCHSGPEYLLTESEGE